MVYSEEKKKPEKVTLSLFYLKRIAVVILKILQRPQSITNR